MKITGPMRFTIFLLALLISPLAKGQETVVDPRTGVKIVFANSEEVFPKSWQTEQINAEVTAIDSTEIKRSISVVTTALLKYPVDLVSSQLEAVYVFKSLSFYGQSFGGTNSKTVVYLSNDGIANGYSNFYLEQLFHAEFSSILIRNFPVQLPASQWLELNPETFNYGNGGVEALRTQQASENFDNGLNTKGFINQYATSSFENDINSYAKNLFLPKPGFKLLLEQNKLIEAKRLLLISFFEKLDPTFTASYFDNFFD